MNKSYLNLIIILIINFLFFTSCKSENINNVDSIWQKYLNTVASRETVSQIKTEYKKKITKQKNGSYKTIHIIKAPDKIYSEIVYPNKNIITIIMNGDKGIIKMNGKFVRKMDKLDLSLNSELAKIFPEHFYMSKNDDIKYIGTVKENGKSYYKIQLKKLKGANIYYLIDKKTYKLYKVILNDGSITSITKVIKRKKINGVNIDWTTQTIKGKDTIIDQVIEAKFNIKVNDSIFKLN